MHKYTVTHFKLPNKIAELIEMRAGPVLPKPHGLLNGPHFSDLKASYFFLFFYLFYFLGLWQKLGQSKFIYQLLFHLTCYVDITCYTT